MYLALRFAYDGTMFPSYARDPGQPESIESHLLRALQTEATAGTPSIVTGSRTDAGVGALANVARIEIERPIEGILPALQSRLPDGIWLRAWARVDEAWNPRHAKSRHYVYHAWPAGDLGKAQEAAARFVGTYDVRAFARMEPERRPERTIDGCTVHEDGGLWRFDVRGPSFLWNQVRRMVGATLAVAAGHAGSEDITASLGTGVAHKAFQTAPADGLVLWDVDYPELCWTDWRPRRAGAVQRALVRAHARRSLLWALGPGGPHPAGLRP